ncbi:MAG: T9SS type A sorting domain-containing protein [Bacteroidetes bacterium]|nr:T9SS type A sorting domain-containing protein [Bacteroidota bacterium]
MKNKTKTTLTFTATVFTFVFNGLRKYSTINKINHFVIVLFLSFFCISGNELKAQISYKVLFLGNSYTGVNNLPQIIHDVALSVSDTLIFDSYTPGGYQLIDHSLDVISQNKIMTGGWDYVVMQGQSQEPITFPLEFSSGANSLYNLIKQYNPCAVTMPYMTWGRKNGDASNCATFPVMCTYQGMDTTIRNKYLNLTLSLNGEVSPVSVVWNYIRQNYPNIDLYQADESHPSTAGSYAAACCFYATLFKKDPALITYNFGLNANDASIIKNVVKTQVFDSLHLWDFKRLPVSDFHYQSGSGVNEVIFNPMPQGVRQTYFWDFGDGSTSSISNPSHAYASDGTYIVELTTTNCDLQGVHTSTTDTLIQFCSHTPTIYTSQPWLCNNDTLWTQAADSYQWYAYGLPIPETNQYLSNYYQYGITGFSVISTLNGCSELSEVFAENAVWSGYYFDALGDPCIGDTVAFAVLHISGFLSGSENILWYKNDTLLPFMTNEDTLFISAPGKYECKVINPNSNCPIDTTYSLLEYDCGIVGIKERDPELFWSIFPNPASETIIIKFTKYPVQEEIQIHSAIGCLTKVIEASETTTVSIAGLPNGLYFIRLKNSKQPPIKFIKQ